MTISFKEKTEAFTDDFTIYASMVVHALKIKLKRSNVKQLLYFHKPPFFSKINY